MAKPLTVENERLRLADPVQRSAALAQAADRSGCADLAHDLAGSIPDPGHSIWALLDLAKSAAARADVPRSDRLLAQAHQAAGPSGSEALLWAAAPIASAEDFCGRLRAVRTAAAVVDADASFDFQHHTDLYQATTALVTGAGRIEPVFFPGGFSGDGSQEAAAVEVASAAGQLDMAGMSLSSVGDPTRRGYLLAAIAAAELEAGHVDKAAATVPSLSALTGVVNHSARGRLLAVAVRTAAAREFDSARDVLVAGLADCFSGELVAVVAALDAQVIDLLADELGMPAAGG